MKDTCMCQRKACVLVQGFSSETGSVLLSAMALILISLGMIAGLAVLVPGSFGFARQHKDMLFAMYTAESGLNYSIESILSSGAEAFPLERTVPGGGHYFVEVVTEPDGTKYLKSTGVYNDRTRVIKVAIENVGGVVVFPKDLVDSKAEDYDAPDLNVPSMPDFPDWYPEQFNSNTSSLGAGVYYYENLYMNAGMLSIQGPAKVFIENDLVFDGSADLALGEGVEIYVKGDVRFRNNSTISGEGNNKLYIQGSLDFGNNGALFFPESASAEILVGGNITGKNNAEMFRGSTEWNFVYVMGNVTLENNVIVGNAGLPNTVFYIPESNSYFVFKNNAEFYGGIFVPYGVVEFKNNAKVVGSVVSKTLVYKNNCEFIFHDRMLTIKVHDDSVEGELGGDVGFGHWSLGD
jgi:hypothetical protein